MAVLYPDDRAWRACEKRDKPIPDEDLRGPDSVECQPDSRHQHTECLLDYSDLGHWGFICGCQCHDPEPTDGRA